MTRNAAIALMLLTAPCALTLQPLQAQRTARMDIPEEFSGRAERLSIDGFGGRNEGRYALGEHSGEFRRIESRFAVGDPLYAQNRGQSSFTLAGPGFDGTAGASCEMRRQSVTIGVLTFDPDKMSYHCSFNDTAAPTPATLVLAEPEPANWRERALALSDRRGEAALGDVALAIRSVHRYQGSRIQSQTPVGYVLEIDGRVIGAVELTDVNPTLMLPTSEPQNVRAAVLLAGLALAVLRDPASSALEDP